MGLAAPYGRFATRRNGRPPRAASTSAEKARAPSRQSPRINVTFGPEAALDDVAHVPVEFGSDDLASSVHKGFGERSRSRSDLEDEVSLADLGSFKQTPELILVMKEILTQPVLRVKPPFVEDLSDFADGLHVYQSYRTVYSILLLPSAGTSITHSIIWLLRFVPTTFDSVIFHSLARAMVSRTITFWATSF